MWLGHFSCFGTTWGHLQTPVLTLSSGPPQCRSSSHHWTSDHQTPQDTPVLWTLRSCHWLAGPSLYVELPQLSMGSIFLYGSSIEGLHQVHTQAGKHHKDHFEVGKLHHTLRWPKERRGRDSTCWTHWSLEVAPSRTVGKLRSPGPYGWNPEGQCKAAEHEASVC